MKQRAKKTTSPGISPAKRRLMRFFAATVVPLLMLGVVDVALRVAGYGYSKKFFLPTKIAGEKFLVPNRAFTHRFFPEKIARAPLPSRMAFKKPDATYRIFLLGESAAYGDPDPSFGVGRFLEVLLETRYPTTDFEVVCVAITAINSHVILPIARDCAKRDGDLWVVYMGNNEMVGPFGASTIFGQQAPSLGFVRSVLALKTTGLGHLLENLASRARGETAAPETWGGIDMFSDNLVRHDDAARLRVYENFRANLNDLLDVGRKAGVPIVLSTVASNLRDCSPFASLHTPGLEPSRLAEWDRLFQRGKKQEAEESYQTALEAYAAAAEIDPYFAELQFRMGTCHLALGDRERAHTAFIKARDFDALAVRTDTRINDLIQAAIDARVNDGVLGLEATHMLASHTKDGIPGKMLFYEHVHFTTAGNYLLARAFADRIEDALPASIKSSGGPRLAADEERACEQQLAITVWDQKRVWDVALGRISDKPFTNQSSHERNVAYCKLRMREVDARTTRDTPAADRKMYLNALARKPDDTQVRWNYAQFLERTGSYPEAIAQGKRICEILPGAPWPQYFVGSMLAKTGRQREAVDYLERALAIQEYFPQARRELDAINSYLGR